MKIRKILLVTCAFYTAAFSGNAFAQLDTLMQSMQQVVQQLDNKKSENKPINETKKAQLQVLKNNESNQANFLVLYRMKNNKPVKKQIVGVDNGGDLTQHLKPKVDDNKFTLLIKVNDEYAYYVESRREEFDKVGDRMEFVSKDGEKLVIILKTAKQFGELGVEGKAAVTGTFMGSPINEVPYCQYGY